MTTIKNLTPHAISFVLDSEGTWTFTVAPEGSVARVTTKTETIGSVETERGIIPVTRTVFGEVEGLPNPEPGTVFVVSSLVAGRCSEREDVFIPNESVRDEKGRIIGCRSLGRI